jgi:hypothetical protein
MVYGNEELPFESEMGTDMKATMTGKTTKTKGAVKKSINQFMRQDSFACVKGQGNPNKRGIAKWSAADAIAEALRVAMAKFLMHFNDKNGRSPVPPVFVQGSGEDVGALGGALQAPLAVSAQGYAHYLERGVQLQRGAAGCGR